MLLILLFTELNSREACTECTVHMKFLDLIGSDTSVVTRHSKNELRTDLNGEATKGPAECGQR